MATESLLSEFPPVSTEQWENIIRENMKGADYASKMVWHPEEGLAVKPYYRAEDLAGLPFLDAAPGEFPYVRSARLPVTGGFAKTWILPILKRQIAPLAARLRPAPKKLHSIARISKALQTLPSFSRIWMRSPCISQASAERLLNC